MSDSKFEKIEVTLTEAAALLSKGNTISDLAGVSQEHMEALYALGYQFYNAQNYDDALNVFKALCVYDTTEGKYFMGMAGCLQELGQFKLAAESYGMACAVEGLVNPEPIYYAAICLLKCNEKDNAIAALESVSIMGREGNEHDAEYIEKCNTLLEVLQNS